MTRPPSPAMIRRQAATAFRNRMRSAPIVVRPPTLREPDDEETPLSDAEVALGVERGWIRPETPFAPARAFGAA